jgi:HlyD family secretion protein
MRTSSIVIPVVLLALGSVVGWSAHRLWSPAAATEEPQDAELAAGEMTVAVTTALVRSAPIDVAVQALGVARAAPAADWVLTSTVSARVDEVTATPGQSVHAGDLLVRFARAPVVAMVTAARADLAAALAEQGTFAASGSAARAEQLTAANADAAAAAELAASRLARLQELRADDLAAERTLAEARSEAQRTQRELHRTAQQLSAWQQGGADQERQRIEAAVAAAREALAARQQLEQDLEVRAPVDGTIVAMTVRPGDLPAAGAALGRMLRGPGRLVDLAVAPGQLAQMQVQMPVIVHAADGDHRGQLVAVVAAADPTTGLAHVVAQLEADDPRPLLDGMAVRAEIVVRRIESAVLVPPAAVVRDGERLIVVKIDAADIAHFVPVQVVVRHTDTCAVDGDVAPGDTIVVGGAYNLPDGAHVAPQREEPR